MGSAACKDRSHFVEQSGFAGELGRCFDKTRASSCTRRVSWNDGLHILGEETAQFQMYRSISQNYWDQKVAVIMKVPCVRR